MKSTDLTTLILSKEVLDLLEGIIDRRVKYHINKENANSKESEKRETRKK